MINRIIAIDHLRGVLLISMVFDHALYFIAGVSFLEMYSNTSTPYTSYLTAIPRLISHIVAPGFFLVLGVSIVLFVNHRISIGWSHTKIRLQLFLRGILLILLQFAVINLVWVSDTDTIFASIQEHFKHLTDSQNTYYYFGVLYCLGVTLSLCALLYRAKSWYLFSGSMLIIVFSAIVSHSKIILPFYFWPLLQPGFSSHISVLYPLLPWFGVALLGMVCGRLLIKQPEKVSITLFKSGLVLLCTGLILRIFEIGNYGLNDYSIPLSFITLSKYPPSIVFLLITIGCNFLLLGILMHLSSKRSWGVVLSVFGRSPLVCYVLHLYALFIVSFFVFEEDNLFLAAIVSMLTLVFIYPICKKLQTQPRTTIQ